MPAGFLSEGIAIYLRLFLSVTLIFARCSADLGLPTHRSCNRCRASADIPCGLASPSRHAWVVFALAVHHSRFVATLLVLQPSLWLICGRLSGFGMNASATSRCTLRQYDLLLCQHITAKYRRSPLRPLGCWVCGMIRPTIPPYLFIERTRPRLLTSYSPLNSAIGLHSSLIICPSIFQMIVVVVL